MQALILADGDAPTRRELDVAWPGWDDDVGLVVAADGGARHAGTLGVAIDVWVGDGDSIDEATLGALEASGVPLERSRQDKDESDAELAILAALRRGAGGIVVVGAWAARASTMPSPTSACSRCRSWPIDRRSSSTPGRGSRSFGHPGPTAPRPAGRSSVARATWSRCCRWARASSG